MQMKSLNWKKLKNTNTASKFIRNPISHKKLYPNFHYTSYHANSWLVKITSNGRYILAPTIYGQFFVFNMLTGQVTAVMKEHQEIEVRDVIFHPYFPLIFSSGDDGLVKVYTYANSEGEEEAA